MLSSRRQGVLVVFVLQAWFSGVRCQTGSVQAPTGTQMEVAAQGDANDNSYDEIVGAPSPNSASANLPACVTTTFPIYQSDLINQRENNCSLQNNGQLVPYGRNTPFGIKWLDDSPPNCSISTVSIAIQGGVSCSGIDEGGLTTLNNIPTAVPYRFPFSNEYQFLCACQTNIDSPIQVFNLEPTGSAYNQGGVNTFMIYNSTGSNGLRELVANATLPIFGLVITNQWVQSGSMNSPRTNFGFTKTGLNQILASGGYSVNGQILASSEEYNTASGVWSSSNNSMLSSRALHQLAPLFDPGTSDASGSAYIVGAGGVDQASIVLSSAEMYNTSSRSWSLMARMKSARARYTLTPLFNGSQAVVAAGGLQGSTGETIALKTAEIYSWDLNSWINCGNMTNARYRHQADVLPDWTVLVMGGQGSNGSGIASVESLNLDTYNFTQVAPMSDARYAFTSTVLRNGSVLVAGGAQLPNVDTTWDNSQLLTSTEIYTNGTWSTLGNLTYPRAGHQAVLLDDGFVIVMGGGGTQAQLSSELWDPKTGYWIPIAPMLASKINFGVALLQNSRVLAFGGSPNSTVTLVNGTTSTYLFSSPFSNSTLSQYTYAPAGAPTIAPAPQVESIRAPPFVSEPPPSNVVVKGPSDLKNATVAALPPNASINLFVSEGLSGGAIGGIVGGVVVFFILVAIATFFILRRRRRLRRAKRANSGIGKIDSGLSNGSFNKHPNGVFKDGASPPDSESSRSTKKSHSAELRSVGMPQYAFASPWGGAENMSPNASGNLGQQSSAVQMPAPVMPSPWGSGISSPWGQPANGHSTGDGAVFNRPMASPFASRAAEKLQSNHSGLRSLRSIDEDNSGGSWNPETQPNTQGSKTGISVPMASQQNSGSSDLSRVSVAIRHELVGADWRIDQKSLVLDKRLGKGGFGEVFRGAHHGSPVAVKVLEINDERTMADACHEFGHLHNLRHSKLVVSYGACVSETTLMLVMELMEEDLFHALASNATGRADSVLYYFRGWQIAVDVASALVFLHSKGLVHLDVKSLNILLKGKRTEAKLGDLGLAKMVPDGHLALQNTLPGTPAYSAPEVMQAQLSWRLRTQGRRDRFRTEVGTPADIFAFGVVLFEICTGNHPARWRQDFTGSFHPSQAPPIISQLVDACLSDEPETRPTALQVLDTLLANRPSFGKR